MVKSIYILEYYEEIQKEDLYYDTYNLLGVFNTEKEAKEKKDYIIKQYKLREDTLYVSLIDLGNSQWEVLYLNSNAIIYALYHIYDTKIDNVVIRETKRIGLYATRKECREKIIEFHKYIGFRDYPISCFKILQYRLGEVYWKDEFICDQCLRE